MFAIIQFQCLILLIVQSPNIHFFSVTARLYIFSNKLIDSSLYHVSNLKKQIIITNPEKNDDIFVQSFVHEEICLLR